MDSEPPKSKYPIHRQIESKNLSAFFITLKKEKTDMLQKELAKRLRARYDTKMDGNEWLEVSSDGIPLCRIDSMLRTPNCPFVLFVGTKKLVKRREFEEYISQKLVI